MREKDIFFPLLMLKKTDKNIEMLWEWEMHSVTMIVLFKK